MQNKKVNESLQEKIRRIQERVQKQKEEKEKERKARLKGQMSLLGEDPVEAVPPKRKGEILVLTDNGYIKQVQKYSEENYRLGIPQFTEKEIEILHKKGSVITGADAKQLFTVKTMFRGTVIN